MAAGAYRRARHAGRTGRVAIPLASLEEFEHEPWTSGPLSGRVSFEPLRQSAGRRAFLRDDEVYPVFRDAARSLVPVLIRAIERIRRELDVTTADRLADALREVFGRVLRELADLENPMRTLVGGRADPDSGVAPPGPTLDADDPVDHHPSIEDLHRASPSSVPPDPAARPGGGHDRQRHLPSIAADPHPATGAADSAPTRGRCCPTTYTPTSCSSRTTRPRSSTPSPPSSPRSRSCTTTPGRTPDELAEELVRMLIRLRRHLPRRLRQR